MLHIATGLFVTKFPMHWYKTAIANHVHLINLCIRLYWNISQLMLDNTATVFSLNAHLEVSLQVNLKLTLLFQMYICCWY